MLSQAGSWLRHSDVRRSQRGPSLFGRSAKPITPKSELLIFKASWVLTASNWTERTTTSIPDQSASLVAAQSVLARA